MQHALVIANRSGVKGPRGDFTKLHNNGIHALHALKQFVSSKRHIHTHSPSTLTGQDDRGIMMGYPAKKSRDVKIMQRNNISKVLKILSLGYRRGRFCFCFFLCFLSFASSLYHWLGFGWSTFSCLLG